jgi:hypothetical protein
MPKNLWPDFDVRKAPRSPKTVVEEAGHGLGEKTNGLVVFYTLRTSAKGETFEVEFSLYSSSLRYHFPFMRIKFPVDAVYPVVVVADKMADEVAKDEDELIALLAKIFAAPSTVETIQRLMSLSQE